MEILHEINLARFWKLVKDNWKIFIVVWVATSIFALIIGFSIPKTYKSEVKLAPESASNNLGAMGSLGAMVGLKLGDMTSSDAIMPMLYPDVVSSPDFLLEVLKIRVTTKDKKVKDVDYKTYLTKYCKATWWSVAMHWVVSIFKKDDNSKSVITGKSADGTGMIMLTLKDGLLLKSLENNIICNVDKKTDVISISVIDQDPLVATILVDSISNRLQNFITDYRTKKARGDVKHLQNLFDKAHKDYKKAQQDYALYSDAHTDIVRNEYKVKLEDLENDVQLKYNIYSQLMLQLKAAQSKVLERTPVYTVIQAPMVPYKHIAPKKMTILFLYLFFATFICFVWLYYKERRK